MNVSLQRVAVAAFVFAVLTAPLPALAYGGPTLGLSALGSFFALIGAVLAGIFGFIWYPIKRLLRSLRRKKAGREDAEP